MAKEVGISIYFRNNRINIHRRAIYAIGRPQYIHLLINREKKQIFIQSCKMDKDAFKVYYQNNQRNAINCYLNSKWLIRHFADLLGVSYTAESMYFPGIILSDGCTMFVDLNHYEVIPHNLA